MPLFSMIRDDTFERYGKGKGRETVERGGAWWKGKGVVERGRDGTNGRETVKRGGSSGKGRGW